MWSDEGDNRWAKVWLTKTHDNNNANHVEAAIWNCCVFIKEEPRGFRYDRHNSRYTRVKNFWKGFIPTAKTGFIFFPVPADNRMQEGEMRARSASVFATLSHRSASPSWHWAWSDGQIYAHSMFVCIWRTFASVIWIKWTIPWNPIHTINSSSLNLFYMLFLQLVFRNCSTQQVHVDHRCGCIGTLYDVGVRSEDAGHITPAAGFLNVMFL